MILQDSDEILDFGETENEEEDNDDLEYDLNEKESKMFMRGLRDVDPSDFFKENKNIIKDVENAIIAKRLENAPGSSTTIDEDDRRFRDPYDQLCWDLMRLLFPKRRKKVRPDASTNSRMY